LLDLLAVALVAAEKAWSKREQQRLELEERLKLEVAALAQRLEDNKHFKNFKQEEEADVGAGAAAEAAAAAAAEAAAAAAAAAYCAHIAAPTDLFNTATAATTKRTISSNINASSSASSSSTTRQGQHLVRISSGSRSNRYLLDAAGAVSCQLG
jgi:membrane protein involved in colicin uptake